MTEDVLEYILKASNHMPMFSLQKIALVRITTFLCNNQHIIGLITSCQFQTVDQIYCTRNQREFHIIKNIANAVILRMHAIGTYKEMILDFLWPVAYRIILWKHLYASTIDNAFLSHFYWTNRGRIDSKRTAKYLIANESIPIIKRFKLACTLCLPLEICKFWIYMLPKDKNLLAKCSKNMDPLAIAWIKVFTVSSYKIEEDMNKLLKYAIKIGSIEAVKYLFSLIPENMKSDKAIFCFECISEKLRFCYFFQEEESDIGFFIISQMGEINEIFLSYNFRAVLSLLIYSSDRNVFLKTWKKCDLVKDVEAVLLLIFRMYYHEVFRDQNYGMLFVRAWLLLPNDYKDYIRNHSALGVICLRALIQDDLQFYKCITSNDNSTIFIGFQQEQWEFLHFLIREEIIATGNLERHKALLMYFLPETQFLACKNFICDVRDKKKKKRNREPL